MPHDLCWSIQCDHGNYTSICCKHHVQSYDRRWSDVKKRAEEAGWLFVGRFACYCPDHAHLYRQEAKSE